MPPTRQDYIDKHTNQIILEFFAKKLTNRCLHKHLMWI
nr:MAG TPA: hypothetical protein [Bacteriophage sp.]